MSNTNYTKWRVTIDCPVNKSRVFVLVANDASSTDRYLQFFNDGKILLSVPHSRVQLFEEL